VRSFRYNTSLSDRRRDLLKQYHATELSGVFHPRRARLRRVYGVGRVSRSRGFGGVVTFPRKFFHILSRSFTFYAQLGDFAECNINRNKETKKHFQRANRMSIPWSTYLFQKVPKHNFRLSLIATNWKSCWPCETDGGNWYPFRSTIKSGTGNFSNVPIVLLHEAIVAKLARNRDIKAMVK